MSKSGEIIRMGHENYCFLCIHCDLSFYEINEILVHIDSHFDTLDTKITTDDTMASPGKNVELNGQTIAELVAEEKMHSINIRSEFKIEDCVEPKTEVAETVFDVYILEETKTVSAFPRIRCKKTGNTVKRKAKKRLEEVANISRNVNEDNTSCPICELNFDNSIECQSHLKEVHKMSSKVFQCYICGLFCKDIHILKRHFRTALHSKFTCYQCNASPAVMSESDPRPHKCFLCKCWFENHQHFRKHFKDVHHKDVDTFFRKKSNCNEYTCYLCKRDFLTKNYLKSHMVVHNEIKPFVCDVCGNRYRTRAILNRHSNVHEGKTYTCHECGKSFPHYARLRIHLYSHRTELNYKCTICSKAFKVQKYLARHMKLHQDEKKYACTFCGKRFTFSSGRRAHEISQHNAV